MNESPELVFVCGTPRQSWHPKGHYPFVNCFTQNRQTRVIKSQELNIKQEPDNDSHIFTVTI